MISWSSWRSPLGAGCGHEDFFGGHEGEFGSDLGCDDFWVDDQAGRDIGDEDKAAIEGE